MSTHCQTAWQTRLYAILTGDATLMALVTGVFDFVPDQQSFPTVTIGDDVFVNWDNHSANGFQGTSTIHTWSQMPGKNEAMSIMNRIYTLLHANIDLGIPGFKTVSSRCTKNQIVVDPDGYTHHGIQVFSLMLGGN